MICHIIQKRLDVFVKILYIEHLLHLVMHLLFWLQSAVPKGLFTFSAPIGKILVLVTYLNNEAKFSEVGFYSGNIANETLYSIVYVHLC